MYEKCLNIETKVYGPDDGKCAATLREPFVHSAQGKHGDALAAYEKSLCIETKLYGTEHQSVKETREHISEIKARLSEPAQTGAFAFPYFFC